MDILEKIPEDFPEFDNFDDFFMARRVYVSAYSYVFVSKKLLNSLSKWIGDRKCLEVMSGSGFLSAGLKAKGIDIIATDNFSWAEKERFKGWQNTFCQVEKIDATEAVSVYGKESDILLMSWPPYDSDIAYDCIKELYSVNKNAVVLYVGEEKNGCTANEKFFDHFEIIEDKSFEDAKKDFKCWLGIYDSPHIGRYSERTIGDGFI